MVAMSPFDRAAAALQAYDRNIRDAICWAHPSWLAGALGVDVRVAETLRAELSSGPRTLLDKASFILCRASGVRMPSMASFLAPGAVMFDALPPEQGLRMLRVRALLFRSAQIRHLIDKGSRMRLADWIGVPLDSIVQASFGAPDIAAFELGGTMLSLDEMDAQTLALEGYFLVIRDEEGAAAMTTPRMLLRLALPRDAGPSRWLNGRVGGLDKQGTRNLITHLSAWLPEWKWLFG
ncbi:type III secretion protein SctK (plasmid) [Mycetohabitans rhizoxinica]|uniref:Type III secretion protein SctK n=2 Tax=Mycetohabitans rhizoxinica TaxID=412963 RepID=A0ABZ2PWL9_9BURK